MMNDHRATTPSRGVLAHPVRGPVTLAELTAGLVWPQLLRIPAMAVQPGRVVIGTAAVLALALIARLFDGGCRVFGVADFAWPLLGSVTSGFEGFAREVYSLRPAAALGALYEGVFGGPVSSLRDRPLTGVLFLAVAAPVWMTAGGAICRMVAVDVAGHVNLSLRESVGFALRRSWTLAWALLLPLTVLGLLLLGLTAAGWLLFSVPVLDAVGGLLYGFFLLTALLVTVLFVGFVVVQALLAPAVAAEGADALDALQRAYAYALGRTARLALYAGGALIIAIVVFSVVRAIVLEGQALASASATAWLSEARINRLLYPSTPEDRSLASLLIERWGQGVGVVLAGFGVSLYFSASTIVYMLCRRVNDEQDLREVWMPGLVDGTLVAENAFGRTGDDDND